MSANNKGVINVNYSNNGNSKRTVRVRNNKRQEF